MVKITHRCNNRYSNLIVGIIVLVCFSNLIVAIIVIIN